MLPHHDLIECPKVAMTPTDNGHRREAHRNRRKEAPSTTPFGHSSRIPGFYRRRAANDRWPESSTTPRPLPGTAHLVVRERHLKACGLVLCAKPLARSGPGSDRGPGNQPA